MNLQKGYKVIYEKIADGERTFFADKLDGTEATQIGDAFKIGEYKLIYEKDGGIFGSTTGAVKDGIRIAAFDEVFTADVNTEDAAMIAEDVEPDEPAEAAVEEEQKETDGTDDEEPANGNTEGDIELEE